MLIFSRGVKKMKKKKIIISTLIFLLLAAASVTSAAEITEINVSGLKKSSDQIVKKQLAFNEGDLFKEKEIALSRQRLFNSDLFNPFSLNIESREINREQLEISVKAEESGVFMIHPWEFGIRKLTGLLGEKFEQKLRNPHGNGLSYNFALDWSDDSYQQYGLEYLAAEGRIYSFDWRNFDRDLEFNRQQFLAEGNFYKLELETLPLLNIKNNYSLKYQKNDYSSLGDELEQEYLIPGYSFNYDAQFYFKTALSRAFSLNDSEKDFNQLTFNLNKDFKVNNKCTIVADLKGGYSSDETPFNYQFTAGGFSKIDGGIPIRGQEYEFAGTKYLKATLEYQRQLWRRDLWGVLFLDSAKISASSRSLADYDWEHDGGLGLIYYSFLGPIRADLGFDELDSDPVFNIGFGSSF